MSYICELIESIFPELFVVQIWISWVGDLDAFLGMLGDLNSFGEVQINLAVHIWSLENKENANNKKRKPYDYHGV